MIKILREAKRTPEFASRALELAGGRNPYGEPIFRCCWGWTRLTWIGGLWTDRDAEGSVIREIFELRQEPKYFPLERWHVERWVPPETYGSPYAWYAMTTEVLNGCAIPTLGPYPHRGDWEHCFTLETAKGEFVQLTPTIAEYCAYLIKRSMKPRLKERRAAVERREERTERDYDGWAFDVLDDAVGAFHEFPWVNVPKDLRGEQNADTD